MIQVNGFGKITKVRMDKLYPKAMITVSLETKLSTWFEIFIDPSYKELFSEDGKGIIGKMISFKGKLFTRSELRKNGFITSLAIMVYEYQIFNKGKVVAHGTRTKQYDEDRWYAGKYK